MAKPDLSPGKAALSTLVDETAKAFIDVNKVFDDEALEVLERAGRVEVHGFGEVNLRDFVQDNLIVPIGAAHIQVQKIHQYVFGNELPGGIDRAMFEKLEKDLQAEGPDGDAAGVAKKHKAVTNFADSVRKLNDGTENNVGSYLETLIETIQEVVEEKESARNYTEHDSYADRGERSNAELIATELDDLLGPVVGLKNTMNGLSRVTSMPDTVINSAIEAMHDKALSNQRSSSVATKS